MNIILKPNYWQQSLIVIKVSLSDTGGNYFQYREIQSE